MRTDDRRPTRAVKIRQDIRAAPTSLRDWIKLKLATSAIEILEWLTRITLTAALGVAVFYLARWMAQHPHALH